MAFDLKFDIPLKHGTFKLKWLSSEPCQFEMNTNPNKITLEAPDIHKVVKALTHALEMHVAYKNGEF